jgi:YCII-related domain
MRATLSHKGRGEKRAQIFPALLSALASLVRLATKGTSPMLYAILCYHDEDHVGSWSKEQDAAVMAKLTVVQDRLTQQGRLGPVARLLQRTASQGLRAALRPGNKFFFIPCRIAATSFVLS